MTGTEEIIVRLGAVIGAAVVVSTAALTLIKQKKMHQVTKSGWEIVTEEIKALRRDSDKHDSKLAVLEASFDFIKGMLTKIDKDISSLESTRNTPCIYHNALESTFNAFKSEVKGMLNEFKQSSEPK